MSLVFKHEGSNINAQIISLIYVTHTVCFDILKGWKEGWKCALLIKNMLNILTHTYSANVSPNNVLKSKATITFLL